MPLERFPGCPEDTGRDISDASSIGMLMASLGILLTDLRGCAICSVGETL